MDERKPKQRRSESEKEADERKWNGRPRESQKRKQKTRVSRKKQLRGLKPTEDERKLQMKLFVKLCVETERLKPLLNDCGNKKTEWSRLKSRGFFYSIGKTLLH